VFLGSSKGLSIGRSSRMIRKRRKELATIVPPKAILQKNVTKRDNIGKNKFNGFSQVATIRKIELLVTSLSIFLICRDAWFINFRTSQHLTFQKEVLSTFEEFTLNHKVNLGDNNIFDVCGKDTIIFNLPNRISKCIGDVLYVPKLAKN
jgi:hypothetical protein